MNRTRNLVLSLIALVAASPLGCAGGSDGTPHDEAGSGLTVRIDALDTASGRIEYSLINDTAESVRVLRWKTGLDPMPDPLFEISLDGAAVNYEGPIIHRVQPEPSHYVEVAPGQRLSAEVDLRLLYDLRADGSYEVQLRPLEPRFVVGDSSVVVHSTGSVRIDIDAEEPSADTRVGAARGQALTRASCTVEQFAELAEVEDAALANTTAAKEYFDEYGYDERAIRWFGTGNTQDAYYVRMGLETIFGWLDRGNIEYVCNAGGWCANGTAAAWVDPYGAPGVINLCEGFWVPDQPPWYTKVIAITHELAHFHTYWLDEGYREAALALAKNRPASARSNAENYALYTVDSEIPCVPGIEDCSGD